MFSLQVVLPVAYIEAPSLPLILVSLLIPLDRVNEGLHPLGVKRLILLQVHDVKLVGVA